MKLPSKFTALVCCVVLIVLAGEGTTLRGQTTGFVYVANLGSSNVSAYTINGTTGALAAVAGSPFPAGTQPHSVTVGPTGQFAYVANSGSNNVSAFTIDGVTGALTPVAGSPFSAGTYPDSVTVHPTGQFAYVANFYSHTVSAYAIDRTTGALTPVAGSPFSAGTYPDWVTVDPTGQFAYVANPASNSVSAYTIDGITLFLEGRGAHGQDLRREDRPACLGRFRRLPQGSVGERAGNGRAGRLGVGRKTLDWNLLRCGAPSKRLRLGSESNP